MLVGDAGRIQTLVDNVLNGPAEGIVHYEAFSVVVMLVGEFKRQSSGSHNYINSGWASETGLVFWLTLRAKPANGEPERTCLMAPFVLIDNEMSLLTGREVFGYSKALGVFQPPTGRGTRVTVNAFGGNFGAGARAQWEPLVEVTAIGAGPMPIGLPGGSSIAAPSSPEEVTTQLAHLVVGERANTELALTEVKTVMADAARHVFLKQFRDAVLPDMACYREVVEAPVSLTEDGIGLSPYEWEVKIERLSSHPIVEELGLPTHTVTPAFELNTDMIIDPAVLVIP